MIPQSAWYAWPEWYLNIFFQKKWPITSTVANGDLVEMNIHAYTKKGLGPSCSVWILINMCMLYNYLVFILYYWTRTRIRQETTMNCKSEPEGKMFPTWTTNAYRATVRKIQAIFKILILLTRNHLWNQEACEAFASPKMMTELSVSGRKGTDIICIPNKHNCRISRSKLK